MKVAIYNNHKFEKEYLLQANADKHGLVLVDGSLSQIAVTLVKTVKASAYSQGTRLLKQKLICTQL